ncbi:MAG: hypothetical protein H0U89_11675 [Acidimicrobiia bacterium]|nr:hypothetical protein [Acidimicrobiia bacterium]
MPLRRLPDGSGGSPAEDPELQLLIEIDQGTVDRLDRQPFMHLDTVAAERDRRGLWNVTPLPGGG